ncbi:MAG TPA: hypothetical protein VN670_08315 [Acidobacteriaceae bacterium]|nr:hypothetical protein [Acidobacteriaceae bacterium]
MASPAAFLEQQSADRMRTQSAHKQTLSDLEFQTHLNQINANIAGNQRNLASDGRAMPQASI